MRYCPDCQTLLDTPQSGSVKPCSACGVDMPAAGWPNDDITLPDTIAAQLSKRSAPIGAHAVLYEVEGEGDVATWLIYWTELSEAIQRDLSEVVCAGDCTHGWGGCRLAFNTRAGRRWLAALRGAQANPRACARGDPHRLRAPRAGSGHRHRLCHRRAPRDSTRDAETRRHFTLIGGLRPPPASLLCALY